MIKYQYTILYVADIIRTLSFYENTFGFKKRFITDENDYAELETGSTIIAFASKDLAKSNLNNGFIEVDLQQKPFGIELAFVTDNVEALVSAAIQNGAQVYEEIKVKPWGQTVAYIRDINGFLIEICSPMGS